MTNLTYPYADSWVLRSAFQKACRQGNLDHATTVAEQLWETDKRTLQRRVKTLALTDIGIGCLHTLLQAFYHTDPRSILKELTYCPKSRASVNLFTISQHHEGYKAFKEQIYTLSETEKRHLLDTDIDLPQKLMLLQTFAKKELNRCLKAKAFPECFFALLRQTRREKLEALFLPFCVLYIAQQEGQKPRIIERTIRKEPLIYGLSASTYDAHTRLGKQAIYYWKQGNTVLKPLILEQVEALLAYVESTQLAREAEYPFSQHLTEQALEAHFFPLTQHIPIYLKTVERTLPELNALRQKLADKQYQGKEA